MSFTNSKRQWSLKVCMGYNNDDAETCKLAKEFLLQAPPYVANEHMEATYINGRKFQIKIVNNDNSYIGANTVSVKSFNLVNSQFESACDPSSCPTNYSDLKTYFEIKEKYTTETKYILIEETISSDSDTLDKTYKRAYGFIAGK